MMKTASEICLYFNLTKIHLLLKSILTQQCNKFQVSLKSKLAETRVNIWKIYSNPIQVINFSKQLCVKLLNPPLPPLLLSPPYSFGPFICFITYTFMLLNSRKYLWSEGGRWEPALLNASMLFPVMTSQAGWRYVFLQIFRLWINAKFKCYR